jgi:hypothetical protein
LKFRRRRYNSGMDMIRELEAMRAEQRTLRAAVDRFDHRLEALERLAESAESLSPPEPEPPPTPSPQVPPAVSGPPPLPPKPVVARQTAEIPRQTRPPRAPGPAGEPAATESFELRLGRVWLVRIGIVILLTGLVFLGNYAYHEFVVRLGPAGKLLLLYLAGAGLCLVGMRVSRRGESLRTYGRVLAAGGCAAIYYATYAAHFVEALRVIDSPVLGGGLLLALGGIFVTLADRLRSQTLAAATIALSFYTAAINPISSFSLFSNVVISAAAVALLARRSWISVSFVSLLGAYGSFAFWRIQQGHTLLPAPLPEGATFWATVLFPLAYWAAHTVAVFLKRVQAFETRSTFLTINNAAFLALAGPLVAGAYPHHFWLASLLFGIVLLALAALASRFDGRAFDGAYLAQGLGLVSLGLFFKFSGWQLAISFALLGFTLVSISRLRHGGVYRFFAGACGLVATGTALGNGLSDAPHARLTASAVAAILLGSAWLLKRRVATARRVDWRALGFAALAGALTIPACLGDDLAGGAIRILLVALVAMALLPLFALAEGEWVAQPLAIFGQCLLVAHAFATPALGAAASLSAGFGLAFLHLWQTRKTSWRFAAQALHVAIPLGLALAWTYANLPLEQSGPAAALIALLLLAHGLLTRIGISAAAGIPFTILALGMALRAEFELASWAAPAATLSLVALQSLLLARAGGRLPLDPRLSRAASLALRGLAVLLAGGMIFAYAPSSTWFLALVAAAFVFFLAACVRPSREALAYAAVLGLAAVSTWLARLTVAPAHAGDLLGFGALALAQQIGKRRALPGFHTTAQALLASVAVLGAWLLLHRLLGAVAGGFLLTVCWSLYAFLVLGGGFVLRERTCRLLGLGILAAAVGRVFLIDVWQLETIWRILSFLVLGAVLLVLGFLYNRHADTLRRWI